MRNNAAAAAGGVLILIIAVFVLWQMGMLGSTSNNRPVACTMEAKQCPDGSYVGRTGPSCEFAQCPGATSSPATTTWLTATDTAQGISFKYPPSLGTVYIQTTNWPPQVTTQSGTFACSQTGTTTAPGGRTVERTILGQTFCVTEEAEGAAGSIYLKETYATLIGNKTRIFTFSLREVQCANYPEPQMSACGQERATFDLGVLMATIAGTAQVQ